MFIESPTSRKSRRLESLLFSDSNTKWLDAGTPSSWKGLGTFAICGFWQFPENHFAGQNISTLISKTLSSGGVGIIVTYTHSTNQLHYTMGTTVNGSFSSGIISIKPDQLKHFCFIWDQENSKLLAYVDGRKFKDIDVTAGSILTNVDGRSLLFGSNQQGGTAGRTLSGYQGGLMAFNKVPTQKEITYMYDTGNVPETLEANCIGDWSLNEKTAFKVTEMVAWNQANLIEGDNIFADAVEQHNHAIITDLVSKSMIFDGANSEVVNVPDDASLKFGTGDFAVSVWVKIDSIGAGQIIFSKHYNNYELNINGGGTIVGYVGGLTSSVGTTVVSAGVWYHVVMTRIGSTLFMYLDRTETSQSNNTASTSNTTDIIEIGSRAGEGIFLTGNICQASVWNKGLSLQEVIELYNDGNPIDETTHSAAANLVSFWEMGGGAGDSISTIVDQQGSNDGTPVNMIADDIVDDIPIGLREPSHLKTIAFTDDELGSINPSAQTSKKDFYTKGRYSSTGLDINTDNFVGNIGVKLSNTPTIVTTDETFAFFTSLTVNASLFNTNLQMMDMFGTPRVAFYGGSFTGHTDNHTFHMNFISGGITAQIHWDIGEKWSIGDNIKYLLVKNGSATDIVANTILYYQLNNGSIRIAPTPFDFDDSADLVSYSFGFADIGSYQTAQGGYKGIIDRISFYDGVPPQGDIDLYFQDLKPSSNILEDVYFQGDSGVDFPVPDSGRTFEYKNYSTEALSAGGGVWLEKDTLLPEIKQSFNFGGTRWFQIENFIPTKEKGYTYIFAYSLDSDRLFASDVTDIFFSNRDGSGKFKYMLGEYNNTRKRIYIAQNAISVQRTIYVHTNETKQNSINTITIFEKDTPTLDNKGYVNGTVANVTANFDGTIGWDTLTDNDTYIGKDSTIARILGGSLHHVSIWKGEISQNEIKRIVNNSLLANANISRLVGQGVDNVLYLNFNEGSFSENGVNVLLKDHSPIGHTVKAMGLVGATSADQLISAPKHLKSIDDNRYDAQEYITQGGILEDEQILFDTGILTD